jgi:hypothetical protein
VNPQTVQAGTFHSIPYRLRALERVVAADEHAGDSLPRDALVLDAVLENEGDRKLKPSNARMPVLKGFQRPFRVADNIGRCDPSATAFVWRALRQHSLKY